MKYRKLVNGKLVNGKKVTNAPESVKMTIDSQCPKKWAFVDMETGDIWVHKSRYPKYKGSQYDFFAVDAEALSCLKQIMDSERYGEVYKNLVKGDTFIYTDRMGKKQEVTYSGIKREVKGVNFYFFDMEDGTTSLIYPSEVKQPTFVKM